MDKKNDPPKSNTPELPQTSALDLLGKQSVRATFKLSLSCIQALHIVSTHLGIKQKSLFDHLIEDTETLSTIARELDRLGQRRSGRVQKTYVISRNSLNSLEETAMQFDTSRDELIEFSVQRLLPVIAEERIKHEKRKEFIGEIGRHFTQGIRLLDKIQQSLGADDPVLNKLAPVMSYYETAFQNMQNLIEKGKTIEDFQDV